VNKNRLKLFFRQLKNHLKEFEKIGRFLALLGRISALNRKFSAFLKHCFFLRFLLKHQCLCGFRAVFSLFSFSLFSGLLIENSN